MTSTHGNVIASQCAAGPEPPSDCDRCDRLFQFRTEWRISEPGWFNAPVPSFGDDTARLLVVGLAPGLRGANRTGRPFTGDFAGELLYATLLSHGFARGTYTADLSDGLVLEDCMISNAVRCVPPHNKPTPQEIANCRPFLAARLESLTKIRAVLALGRIAHDQVVSALQLKRARHPFAHAARHALRPGLTLFDSFHCSRYNTNTGRLTPEMFATVVGAIREHLDASSVPTQTR